MAGGRIIDTVLFDVGETLLEFGSERRHLPAGLRLGYDYLREQGYPLPSFEGYARRLHRGLALRLLWSRMVTRRELKPVPAVQSGHRAMGIELDSATAAEVAHRCYAAMGVERKAGAGARMALNALRERGYRLGIVSNTFSPPGGLDQHLEAEGILEYFSVRVYSCDVGYMKPHRGIFQCALDRLGAVPSAAVYVGDKAGIDVKGAGRMGMVTVLKLPAGKRPPWRWRPDHVIETLAEVPDIVRSYPSVRPADSATGALRV